MPVLKVSVIVDFKVVGRHCTGQPNPPTTHLIVRVTRYITLRAR